MGTNPNPSTQSFPVTNPDPGSEVGTSQVGILVELRVQSLIMLEAFGLKDFDLDAARQQVLTVIS